MVVLGLCHSPVHLILNTTATPWYIIEYVKCSNISTLEDTITDIKHVQTACLIF